MTTIKQLIQASPARSNEIFAKLLDTSEGAVKTRQRLLTELTEELSQLAQLEERHLFPVLRKHKDMRDLVREAIQDNRQTKLLLAELGRTPVENEEFATKVADLRRTFQQHVRDERKELLPSIVKALTDDEARGVVESIEAAKAQAEDTRRTEADQRRAEARSARAPYERVERAAKSVSEAAAAEAAMVDQAAGDALSSAQDAGRQVVELFGRAAEETGEIARRASAEIGAISQSGEVVRTGVRDLSREWVELAQARLQGNLEDMITIARSRTLPELVEAQGALVRHNLEMMVENTQRLLRKTLRVADSAKEPLAQREWHSGRAR